MNRQIVSPFLFAFLACFLSLPGCGGSGGEATYDSSSATDQSAEEIEESENYEAEYEAQNERMESESEE